MLCSRYVLLLGILLVVRVDLLDLVLAERV